MDKSGPSIDGQTLRWFSTDQLNLVQKELANVTDLQVYGITDTGKIQTVFKSAIYFADQKHHSEDKQKSLVDIFQTVTARVSHPEPQPHHVTHAAPTPATSRVSAAATHGLHPSPPAASDVNSAREVDRVITDLNGVLNAIRSKDLAALDHVSTTLRETPEAMLEALKVVKETFINPYKLTEFCNKMYEIISDKLKDNEDFLLKANKIDTSLLLHAPSDRLKKEPDFWINVLQEGGSHLGMDDSLRDNEKVMLEVARYKITDFIPGDSLSNNPKFMLDAIAINPITIRRASHQLKTDLNFLVDAAKIDPKILDHVSDSISDTIIEDVKRRMKS